MAAISDRELAVVELKDVALPTSSDIKDCELGDIHNMDADDDVNVEVHKSMSTGVKARHHHHFYGHIWRRFIPALLVYPVWLYTMISRDAFEDAFGTYYPLSMAMVIGSMIAGSTPLGGGVIAFPVAVLVIKFKPAQGRDFSLIIQSVGMTAASFLIMYAKRDLCHTWLIMWFTFSAVVGMIVGFEVDMSPFLINVTFTTAIVCFAISFAYRNLIAKKRLPQNASDMSPPTRTPPDDAWVLIEGGFDLSSTSVYKTFGKLFPWVLTSIACLFGMVGGFLTSKLGSGADMMAYIFGVFVWNGCVPEEARLPDNMLTASSVVIMAACSVIGTILRLLQEGGISDEVILCWAACTPIVVLGAPLGSLLLTPSMTRKLRVCFYILSIVQLASFGILKIKGNLTAWAVVVCAITTTVFVLALHFIFVVRRQRVPSAKVSA
jgi:uncharacterized membrane protein YfcA